MQAIMVTEQGGPEVMQVVDVPIPEPGPGEVLVRVLAAGVGPWDAHLRSGQFPADLPHIPGGEFAGLVEGDSGDHAAFQDGEPVYGYPGLTGCYAQYVSCPAEQMASIPVGLDVVDAGAVPVDALTALQGLKEVLSLGTGNAASVLITAAAGGLGHFAVQIARALGAVVIATASEQHHDFVHKLGAAFVIDHRQPDWPDQVRKLTNGGAERVLACATPTLPGAAAAARDGAVIATPAGGDSLPDSDRVRWRRYNGAPRGSDLIAMAPWFDDGSVLVEVSHRYFWTDAADAHREVEQGHTRGKLLLIVDEDLAREAGV